MNNTPETDKAERMAYSQEYMVDTEFARKLERERDEAQADCLEQARLLGMGSEREARLISERDDALSQIAQAECRAERFCQERDEARTDLEFRRGLYKVQEQYLETARRERDDAVEEIKEWETLCLWGGTPEHIHGFIGGQQTRIWHLECERDEAKNEILGWENKWKCAVDMAARAELERDDALNKLKELKDILR